MRGSWAKSKNKEEVGQREGNRAKKAQGTITERGKVSGFHRGNEREEALIKEE
jgi:hypothetical protein